MTRTILALILAISPFVLHAAVASAKSADQNQPPADWTCYSRGYRSFGPPVGDIWETETARGGSQAEAEQNALSRCYSSGLRMCMVQSCWTR